MAFVVADDKVEDFLKEKADKDKVKQIYKAAERFEKHHKVKPQTNADHIRSMSDEELAGFLVSIEKDTKNYCTWDSVPCCLLWLTSEAKE